MAWFEQRMNYPSLHVYRPMLPAPCVVMRLQSSAQGQPTPYGLGSHLLMGPKRVQSEL